LIFSKPKINPTHEGALMNILKPFAVIAAIAAIGGCASTSAHIGQSPCAGCDFQKLPTIVVLNTGD
jgi:hypothetical protein